MWGKKTTTVPVVIGAFGLVNKGICDNRFLDRLSCYPCYNNPEGNTLAAAEFFRLLKASGPIAAKQSNGTRENTQILSSNNKV